MAHNWSLRNRVAIILALFGAAVSLSLATIIYLASLDMEESLIDDTLSAELDDFVARRQRNPQSMPERTATIRAYVVPRGADNGTTPAEIRDLAPGRHQIRLEGSSFRAAVRAVDDQRFVILYGTDTLTERENRLLLLLAVSVVVVTLVSAMIGRWLASRAIAPVTALARRVVELQPEDELTPLAGEFPWVEVHRLAENFDGYLGRLHEFIERERLFTGDVSHELRTPLSVIDGATELLLGDPGLDAGQRKRVDRIARAATDMSKITAALLALAREQGESGEQVSACDCLTVVREEIERYRELFRHKPIRVSLEVKDQPALKVDHAIMSMVLGNLLRNAFSFTEEGEILVRIDRHCISVQDDGPGLEAEDTRQLFRPYVRSDRSPGAGIGLSLVWRLCQRQGWQLEIHNLERGGVLARVDMRPPAGA